ncbi:MAG TPA: hypothetical protein VFR03_11975 [Thermoanaerobaculia bacterium]|nr:hypothetical protein [Thermoanaerobaculia bacterium]
MLARGERPDRATLIDWGTQLLEILAEAHAEGALYRYLTEDDIFFTPEGRLFLAGWGSPGPLPGEPYTVQNDLYAAGCLLRRLAFASLRGGRGPGARDPLVKVLARATFPGPRTRYESAAEMAAALREAGQAEVRTGPRRLDRPPGAGARVARFPGTSPRRPSGPDTPSRSRTEDGALWHALILLVISLMLMAFLLVTGGIILHRDTHSWRSGGLPPALPASLAAH